VALLLQQQVQLTGKIMNWNNLSTEAELSDILQKSYQTPQAIFKHSTRCSTSSMIKNRLEKSESKANVSFYLLDLIAHRALSNQIAADLNVTHESPQVLLVINGKCVYDESHLGIRMDEIDEAVFSNN
jgi:bacillithiol system protein YtxJ